MCSGCWLAQTKPGGGEYGLAGRNAPTWSGDPPSSSPFTSPSIHVFGGVPGCVPEVPAPGDTMDLHRPQSSFFQRWSLQVVAPDNGRCRCTEIWKHDVWKRKIKSDYLKTWLFRKKLVVRFRDDLFIFKLKRVFRAFEIQFFFALAYTNSRYALGAKHAMER